MLHRVLAVGLLGVLGGWLAGCVDYGPGPAVTACEALLRALDRAPAEGRSLACENLARAVADGGLMFQPSMQAACLEEAGQVSPPSLLTPSWFREHLPACTELFSGRRLPGEGCRVTLECTEDAYCDGSGASCPGTCTVYTARGEDCGAGQPACDPFLDTCDLTCAALAQADEACGAHRRCAPGLTCVDQVCLAPQAEDGSCDLAAAFGQGCEEGLHCAPDDHCRPPQGVEQPCLTRAELAELIFSGITGGLGLLAYAQCAAGLVCVEGACSAPAARGAVCDPLDWPACQSGLGCDPATAECTALRPPGATCETSALGCQAGAFCSRELDAEVGSCTPLLASGEACTSPFECQAGLTCRESVCAPDRCRDFLIPALASAAGVQGATP